MAKNTTIPGIGFKMVEQPPVYGPTKPVVKNNPVVSEPVVSRYTSQEDDFVDTPVIETKTKEKKKKEKIKTDESVSRYFGGAYGEAIGDLDTDFSDDDAESIRERMYRQNQGQLDAINKVYDDMIAGVEKEGKTDLNKQRSIASRSGLVGSGRGERQRQNVVDSIQEEKDLVENQRMAKIQSILFDLDSRVEKEIAAKREEVAGNRDAYLNFLKDAKTQAQEEIKNLAGLGVTIDEMAPEDIQDFMKYTGYDEMTLKSLWNNSLDRQNRIEYQYKVLDNGKVLAYGQDPKTGELVTDEYQFDVPVELDVDEEIKDINGVPMIVKTEDGVVTSVRKVSDLTGGEDVDNEKIDSLTELKDLATELKTLEGKSAAVGAGFKKALGILPGISSDAIPGSARANYEAKMNQLVDKLASTNLDKLKGPMSDKDIAFLRSIGTSLTGSMSETAFEKELDNIIERAEKGIKKAQKSSKQGEETQSYDSIESYIDENPDELDTIEELVNTIREDNPKATDDEIESYILQELINTNMEQSFNSAGNASASNIKIPPKSRLAYVNNNPGNLKFAGQKGAVRGEKGFAKFATAMDGFNALIRQVKLDQGRGLTLEKFINKFAPPTENDTKLYIKQLATMLGVKHTEKIANIDATALAKAVAKKESSSTFA